MEKMNYHAFVQKVKKELSDREDAPLKDGNSIAYGKRSSYTDLWYDGNEINLYAYWQGHQIKDKEKGIDILLMGQDWGNPTNDPENSKSIRDVISGKRKTCYDENAAKLSPTDSVLIEMFSILGCDITKTDPGKRIFFTNYCLGYRTGSEQGSMKKRIMKLDREYFEELVEILKPKIIICLGKMTYECVTGKPVKRWVDTLKTGSPFKAEYPGSDKIVVYGVAHTGARGMSNIGSKDVVRQSWRKIAEDIGG